MVDLLKKIQKVVSEQIPGLQAKEFAKFIEQAEKDKDQVQLLLRSNSDSTKVIVGLNKDIIELLATIKELRGRVQSRESLDVDIELFEKDRFRFDCRQELREHQIADADNRSILVQNMFETVFRNTVVRNRVLGDIPCKTRYQNPDGTTSEYTTTEHADATTAITEE